MPRSSQAGQFALATTAFRPREWSRRRRETGHIDAISLRHTPAASKVI
jgi:hypothetical protein